MTSIFADLSNLKRYVNMSTLRWSAAGAGAVGVITFAANFASVLSLFQPEGATSTQIERLQAELSDQRAMIAQLLERTAPKNEQDADPARIAEKQEAAKRTLLTDPEAARAIASGDLRAGFLALQTRARSTSDEAVQDWRDLGALAYDRDPQIALEAYREAVRIDPEDFGSWISLAVLELEQAGDMEAAVAAAYRAEKTGNNQAQELSALLMVAELEFEIKDYATAGSRYRQIAAILEADLEADPKNADLRMRLSETLEGIGDVAIEQGDLRGALAAFEKGLVLDRSLLAESPDDLERQRDVSPALERIGLVNLQLDNIDAARDAFEESLAIDRALAAANPKSVEARRDLSMSLGRMGDVQERAGAYEKAERAYRESLQISRMLAASNPRSALIRDDMRFALEKIGDTSMRSGDRNAAETAYAESLALARSRVSAFPAQTPGWLDLSMILEKIGIATEDKTYWREALQILKALDEDNLLDAGGKERLKTIQARLADVS